MMAERRNGGKPRREEKNKTSGSVNERKRQTHSRKYDVTGGEKQKQEAKVKMYRENRDRHTHHNISSTRTANVLYPTCAVAVSMWTFHTSSSSPRNRNI